MRRERGRDPALDVQRVVVNGHELVVLSYRGSRVPSTLTPAEREIARRVARGETNAEIARARKSSPRTVANQLAQIFRKLGVSSRAELGAQLRRA